MPILEKREQSQIDDLSIHFKKPKKEEQIYPRRKEIIMIKAEIIEKENRKNSRLKSLKPNADSLRRSGI